MKCRDCPLSLVCTADRLHQRYRLEYCPLCDRLSCIDRKDREVRLNAFPTGPAVFTASTTGTVADATANLCTTTVYIPVTALRCELRTGANVHITTGRANFQSPGYSHATFDPAHNQSSRRLLVLRACVGCATQLDHPQGLHYRITDLDKQAAYEKEKAGSVPAFKLK